MSGRNVGAALTGMNRGIRNRQQVRATDADYDWRQGRREKTLEDEEFYDPMRRETATMGLNKARRNERFEAGTDEDRYTRREWEMLEGQREADVGEARQPGIMSRIPQEDDTAEMDYEVRQAQQGPTLSGIQRGEDVSRASQEGVLAGIRYGDEKAAREAELSTAKQPGAMAQVGRDEEAAVLDQESKQRQGVYGEGDMADYQRGQSYDEYMRNADMAVQNLEATGNPIAIETFYNDMYDDDGQITITKNADGTYTGDYGDGNVVPNIPKDELIAKTREFFESGAPPQGGMGFGGGMSMGGRSGERGRGRGGKGATQSAKQQQIYGQAEVLMKTEGLGKYEALAKAYQLEGESARTSPVEQARGFYKDMMKQLIPDLDMLEGEERSAAIKGAQSEAEQLTRDFMGVDFSEYNEGSGGGIPRGGEGGGTQIPAHDVKMLEDNDTPEMRALFDETYGEGAAEQVLNG